MNNPKAIKILIIHAIKYIEFKKFTWRMNVKIHSRERKSTSYGILLRNKKEG